MRARYFHPIRKKLIPTPSRLALPIDLSKQMLYNGT